MQNYLTMGEIMERKVAILLTIILSLLIGLSGCSTNSVVGLDPQSHYVYPNSNITRLGHVSGKAIKSGIFMSPLFLDGDMKQLAINDALRNAGGKPETNKIQKVLINYITTEKYTDYYIFHTLECNVEGEAVEMEIIDKATVASPNKDK